MRSVITFVFVMGAQLTGAQSFSGIVQDRETQTPLEGVHIQVVNSSLGTSSGQDGKFTINDFPKGMHTIRISAVGYASMERTLNEDEMEVMITLESSAMLLNNAVTITAQRSEQLTFDVSQSVTILSADELIKKSSRSTPEALMNESGIWVQKTNHGGGSPVIRGLVGNQVWMASG